MKYLVLLLLCFSLSNVLADNDHDTDSQTAQIGLTVQAALSASKMRDLDFGNAFSGDPSKIVSTSNGAQFNVTGEPCRSFSIQVPSSVTMVTGSGASPTEQIIVNQFQSSPSGSGTISSDGTSTINVGATRAGLLSNQTSGDYSVAFTVVLTYQ